jgi:hypothetical protein
VVAPQRRLVRVALIVVLGLAVVIGAFVVTAPSYEAADKLSLAPVPLATGEPIATDVPRAAAVAASSTVTPVPTRTTSDETEFERVLHPFLVDAKRRRAAAAAEEPGYWTRLDPKLNSTRLNFLLYGYGETHEPPITERAYIGSLTIFSYDYATRQIDLVSLTHDIRAPEAERYLHKQNGQDQVGPIKIDRAYPVGGFDLMRRTIEDASGLAIDFQMAFKESAIAGATDSVFGGIDVDVPLAFKVNAFYLDGEKYPAGEFAQGRQHLNGVQVIQFIKTVPVEEHYDPSLEHNARKHLVFRSLMDAMREHVGDVTFLGRAALFFSGQVAHDSIAYDFDLRTLMVDNLRSMMTDFNRSEARDKDVPSVDRTLYVVDPASGDGGVQWVQANAVTNPITRKDIDEHRYGELAMEVPYNGDPYAPDLAHQYWGDVRKLISAKLAD